MNTCHVQDDIRRDKEHLREVMLNALTKVTFAKQQDWPQTQGCLTPEHFRAFSLGINLESGVLRIGLVCHWVVLVCLVPKPSSGFTL